MNAPHLLRKYPLCIPLRLHCCYSSTHWYRSKPYQLCILSMTWNLHQTLSKLVSVHVSRRITLQDNKLSLSYKKAHHNLHSHCTFPKYPTQWEAQTGLQKAIWELTLHRKQKYHQHNPRPSSFVTDDTSDHFSWSSETETEAKCWRF